MIVAVLVWFMVIVSGLMAGLYFAFSTFVMRALGQIEPVAGMSAMNAINAVITRTIFLPLFLVSSLVALGLAVMGALRWDEAGYPAMALGGAFYFVGMFLVTMVRNVPLNNALAASDPDSPDGLQLWRDYGVRWTRWNHVRTLACIAALVLFVVAACHQTMA